MIFSKDFFICYLATPWPNMSHYQGDSLTKRLCITCVFCQFSAQSSSQALQWGWITNPSQGPSGVSTGIVLISWQCLNPLDHSSPDNGDQRILQSDWMRGTKGHTQPNLAVSDPTFPYLAILPEILMFKECCDLIGSEHFRAYLKIKTFPRHTIFAKS